MKNNTNGRLLAQTWSCRPYQDNYDKVMEICEKTGRKPAEVLRDAIDEWLLMRNADATGADAPPTDDRQSDLEAKIEELRQDIRLLAERHEELARSIDYVQRRDQIGRAACRGREESAVGRGEVKHKITNQNVEE